MTQTVAKTVSLLALTMVIAPCLLYFAGWVGQEVVTSTALVGTALWFVATPVWMGRELPIDAAEVEI